VILSPSDLTPLLARGGYGLGGMYGPYRDLVMLEATRNLITKLPLWHIPAMNRMLVEMVMHSDARDQLTEELEKAAPGWRKNRQDLEGHGFADATIAQGAALPWGDTFDSLTFPDDEKLGTRLGAEDLSITLPASTRGPFTTDIATISIPSFWRGSINAAEDLSPSASKADDGSLVIQVQKERFRYSAFGLHCLGPNVRF
jgi:CRISPR-associated endonuclease/helicase Cas3